MKNWFFKSLACSALLCLSGCSMCCSPFDYDYPTYGGITQRADPEWGRVGSRFSDANFNYVGPSADSNLEVVEPKKIRRGIGDDLDDSDGFAPTNQGVLPAPGDSSDPPPRRIPEIDDETTADRTWRNREPGDGPGWR